MGPFVFEFQAIRRRAFTAQHFADRLDAFFTKLPTGAEASGSGGHSSGHSISAAAPITTSSPPPATSLIRLQSFNRPEPP
jgi:hypothetical protein